MKQTENILLPKNPDLTKTSHCTSANLRYYLSTLVTIIPKNIIELIVDYISHSWRSISVQFLPAVVSHSGGKADSAKLCLQLLLACLLYLISLLLVKPCVISSAKCTLCKVRNPSIQNLRSKNLVPMEKPFFLYSFRMRITTASLKVLELLNLHWWYRYSIFC